MPPECKVCVDPRADDINRTLDNGGGVRETAAAFAIPKSTMARHALHRGQADASRRVTAPAGAEPERRPERRPCLVCRSAARASIEAALLRGEPADAIEAAHGAPSADTIRRHAQVCILELLHAARTEDARELLQEARSAIEELVDYARTLLKDANQGERDEDGHTVRGSLRERAASIAAAARAFELLGKITGELGPDVEIRILELPQWAVLRSALLAALGPFPEAMAAVVAALRRIETGAPAPAEVLSVRELPADAEDDA
jgi:hypothetical protein